MDIYATHLPLLKRLDSHYPIRNIVEFGAGHYSTPLFLDRRYFPLVEKLVSFETDKGWYDSMKTAFVDDRLFLIYEEKSLHEQVTPFLFLGCDLVFVDNGNRASERVQVLEELNTLQPASLVVVHDYDVREYQHATRDFPLRLAYTEVVPHTALLFSKNCPYLQSWISL